MIYPFCKGIEAVCAKEGIKGRITQWALEKDYGIPRDQFWEMLYQPKHHETLFLQHTDLEVLAQMRRLRYAGHRIHIVTARTTETSEAFCREVVRRDNIPLDSLTFTKDKGPQVNELDAAFSLDDGPHNYAALDQPNHFTWLMDAPHNAGFERCEQGRPVRRAMTVTDFATTVTAFQHHGVQLRGVAA